MTERELRAQLGLLDHARVGDKLSYRSIEEYQACSITGKLRRVFIKEQPFCSCKSRIMKWLLAQLTAYRLQRFFHVASFLTHDGGGKPLLLHMPLHGRSDSKRLH